MSEQMQKHPSLFDTIRDTVLVPFHPAGTPFITGAAIVTAIFFFFDDGLGLAALLVTLFITYFFRDPVRTTPVGSSLVISPADGRVIAITEDVPLPKEIADAEDRHDFTRISIFLSVFDVHVNRSPVDGTVVRDAYIPGKFVNAALDKASEDNERAVALLETPGGKTVGVVQIAGLIARRIVTDMTEGKRFAAGERYGIIRFGSRADIYLPAGVSPLVCVGQRAVGGETVLADLDNGPASPREGRAA